MKIKISYEDINKNFSVDEIRPGSGFNSYDTHLVCKHKKGDRDNAWLTLSSEIVNALIVNHKKRYPNAQVWNDVKKIK